MIFFSLISLLAIAFAETPETPRIQIHARQFSISITACVPVGGVLRLRKVSRAVQEAQARDSGNRTPLLREAIRLAPEYFPPQAGVIAVKQVDGRTPYFLINLNRAFSNSKFWRGRKRRDSILALHALARNVAFMNAPKGNPLPVQFVIEGKRTAKIGAFVANRPLPPEKIISPS